MQEDDGKEHASVDATVDQAEVVVASRLTRVLNQDGSRRVGHDDDHVGHHHDEGQWLRTGHTLGRNLELELLAEQCTDSRMDACDEHPGPAHESEEYHLPGYD